MRINRLIMLLLFFFIFQTLSYSEIVHHLEDINIQISSHNGYTEFQGNFNSFADPGKPNIPCISKRFLLPYDTDLSTINVNIKSDKKLINGNFEVPPVGPNNIDGEDVWLGEDKIVEGKNISIYSKDEFFPANQLVNFQTGKLKDYKIIEIYYSPIQYNPISKTIKKAYNSSLSITFKKKTSREVFEYPYSANTEKKIKMITTNSEDYIKDYATNGRKISNRLPGYLIITSSSLKNSLTKLDYFKRVTASSGFNVIVATESEWGGGTDMQAALNIREWLKSYVGTNGIEHILFIGNPSSGAVPMKVVSPEYSDRYRPYIDFFHGELSGEWDLDGDGHYGRYGAFNSKDMGPGGADMYAEVHVGRIPYYNNLSEVDAILEKIADYKSAQSNDCTWRINAFMPMSDFNYYYRGDASMYGNAMINKVFDPAGWPTTTIFGSSCNINSVVQLWNSDSYGVVLWQAHGLADLAQGVMTTNDAARLNDTYPSHVYQVSCHNGKPEQSNNLGYAILKHAAVSTVASAVQVLYGTMGNLGDKGAARHRGYKYVENLVLNKQVSGEALDGARSELPNKSSTDWLNLVELNLYGCPANGPYVMDVPVPIDNILENNNTSSFNIDHIKNGNSILFKLNSENHNGGEINIYSLKGQKVKTVSIKKDVTKVVLNQDDQIISKGIYIYTINLKLKNGTTKIISNKLNL